MVCDFRVLPGLANKRDWANTFGGLTWAAAETSVCCCCCCCYCLATHLSSSSSVITTMTPKTTPHLEAFVMRESRLPRLASPRLALELKQPRSFSRVGNTRAERCLPKPRSLCHCLCLCLCPCDKAVSRCPLYPRLCQDCHPARWLISLDMFLNSIKRLKLLRPQTRRAARLALSHSFTPPLSLSLTLSLFISRSQLLLLLVAAAAVYYY